jgi:membrane-bound serine protease (ClpP class)
VRTLRLSSLLLLALAAAISLPGATSAAGESSVVLIEVEGTIVPVVAQYVERGIAHAEATGAQACIIKLNTPGGLLDSTEEIVSSIMNADVPVITYVSPKGAWAASAGTFITLASHIAVMTPGTTIGAAHPVSGDGQEIPEYQLEKITEFSAKWMRTIAEDRGRNAEEAVLAVTERQVLHRYPGARGQPRRHAGGIPRVLARTGRREGDRLASGRIVVLETSARRSSPRT